MVTKLYPFCLKSLHIYTDFHTIIPFSFFLNFSTAIYWVFLLLVSFWFYTSINIAFFLKQVSHSLSSLFEVYCSITANKTPPSGIHSVCWLQWSILDLSLHPNSRLSSMNPVISWHMATQYFPKQEVIYHISKQNLFLCSKSLRQLKSSLQNFAMHFFNNFVP